MHNLPHFQHSFSLTIALFLSLYYEEMFILFRYNEYYISVVFKKGEKIDSGIKKMAVSWEISWIWKECIVVKSKLFAGSGSVALRHLNPNN